jgi:hypothetical protein
MKKPNNPGNEGAVPAAVHHVHMDRDKRSYWRRAHHDWKFWVGMFLMLSALAIYVMSDNLSRLPPFRSQPMSNGLAP